MPSWEELFVDREIDEAWRSFRRQVTAALEEPDDVDWLFIPESPTVDGRSASVIRNGLWFMVRGGSAKAVEFSGDDIDRAVAHLIAILRRELEVLHPSFMLWVAEPETDAEHRVELRLATRTPAPDRLPGVRSEVWSSLDPQMLVENVDTFLADKFGHAPDKAEDGQVVIEGRRGGLCSVGVHDFNIEVWTAIAVGLESDAARAGAIDMLASLTNDHPRYRFFLSDEMFIAATIVDGVTFVPDQLDRAIDATLQMHVDFDGLSDFLIELAHPEPGCQPEPAEASGVQETLF